VGVGRFIDTAAELLSWLQWLERDDADIGLARLAGCRGS
jgi:hypothetical protein